MTSRFGAPWGARVKISADLLGSSLMASQIRLANTTEHDDAALNQHAGGTLISLSRRSSSVA